MKKQNTRLYINNQYHTNIYKIGKSSNINKRQNRLNKYQPIGSGLQCVFYQQTHFADYLEKQYHNKLKQYKIFGEFFDVDENTIKQTFQNEFYPIKSCDNIENKQITNNIDTNFIDVMDGKQIIIVLVQKNVEYYYNGQWQHLLKVISTKKDSIDKQLVSYNRMNRDTCMNKINYFDLLTTYEISNEEFIETYKQYYVNNGFYLNFTEFKIEHKHIQDESMQYLPYIEKWFSQHTEPPKRLDQIDGFPIGEKIYRIINSKTSYKQIREKLKQYMDVSPSHTRSGLSNEYKFKVVKEWIQINKRLPTMNDTQKDYNFKLHSFFYKGLDGNYGDEIKQTFKNYQNQYSYRSKGNINKRMQIFQDNCEKYIKDYLQQHDNVISIQTPTYEECQQHNIVFRNWQDMIGISKNADKFKDVKEYLETTYNIKLIARICSIPKEQYTVLKLKQICRDNNIKGFSSWNKETLIKELKDRKLID